MAIQDKATLKTYFESGDVPTQQQYADLIESQFNLGETTTQAISSSVSFPSADVEYLNLSKAYLPGIGVGSAKIGTSFAVGRTLEVSGSVISTGTGSFGHLSITQGAVSASAAIITHHITASGNISASAGITASSAFFSGNITGSSISASRTSSFGQLSASRMRTDIIDVKSQINLDHNSVITLRDDSGNSNDVFLYNQADTAIYIGDVDFPTVIQGSSYLFNTGNTGGMDLRCNITMSYGVGNNISSSAASTASFGRLNLQDVGSAGNKSISASGMIETAGAISSSTGITASAAFFSGNITSSGTISASGMIQTAGAISSSTGITSSGIFLSGNITGSGMVSSSGTGVHSVGGDFYTEGEITIAENADNSTGFYISQNNGVQRQAVHMTTGNNLVFGNLVFPTKVSGSLILVESKGDVSIRTTEGVGDEVKIGRRMTNSSSTTKVTINTIEGHITSSGGLKIDGSVIDFTNLPTSDPEVAGRLWNSSGDLKISIG